MRILELGSYIVPAYAGMILAEQGHDVVKWTNGADPILSLFRGAELWQWINHRKQLVDEHAAHIGRILGADTDFDIVIDNFRPATLAKWGIDPAELARDHDLVWVSMRADVGDVSFDAIAQARAWGDVAPYVPFYIGDTVGGLWLAFKALAVNGKPGHYVVHQATSLAKLVEGELVVDIDRGSRVPWDLDAYGIIDDVAVVEHRGRRYEEPVRSREWKREHLKHTQGRFTI